VCVCVVGRLAVAREGLLFMLVLRVREKSV